MLLGSNTEAVTRFEIQPFLDPALPEVARFLHGHADGDGVVDPAGIAGRLRWLLVENPLTPAAAQHGFCIRDAAGAIRGLLVQFPRAFVADDRRLVGLGSGGFFVDPEARTLGFYLFRRYLNSPGYAFFFATSCNANSAAVWKAVGACAIPNSDTEYVLPLRCDALLSSFLAGRTSSAFAVDVARVVGRCANPIVERLGRSSPGLVTEPSRDWEKLAELSRRHRPSAWMTTDRSAAFLQWRYGPSAPNHPFDIRVFRDEGGHEGWFSLGTITRGGRRPIRACVVLDAVWPRDTMSFRTIVPAIVRAAAPGTDAVFFQPRPGVDYGECSRWIIARRSQAPRVFVATRKDGVSVPGASLDLVPADGEGAL
jgi:hypothetical protein